MSLGLVHPWVLPSVAAVVLHLAALRLHVDPSQPAPRQAEVIRLSMTTLTPPAAPQPQAELPPPPPPQAMRPRPLKRKLPTPRPEPVRPITEAPSQVVLAEPEPEPVEETEPEPEPLEVVEELKEVEEAAPLEAVAFAPPQPQAPARVDLGPYRDGIHGALVSHRRYPSLALRLDLEGVVEVAVQIRKDGTLLEQPQIVVSSGHAILDKEVLRMVKKAAPFPPLPQDYRGVTAEFRIPVHFQIPR
jgi:periplasmic protein TonB